MESVIKTFYWLFIIGCISFLLIGYVTGKINYVNYGIKTVGIAFGAYVIGVLIGGIFAMKIEIIGIQFFFLLLALIPLAILFYVIVSFEAVFNPHHYFFGGSFVLGMLTAAKVSIDKYGL